MTVKHIFKHCEVICTSMLEASGANCWYVRAYVNDELRLSTTVEADSSREAARIVADMLV